jgi:GNAT superfamily N-acetyltransferase
MVEGEPPGPHAAADDFASLPPGSRLEDKHVFGLVDSQGRIVAMLEAIRGYPEPRTWWIGLMMVDPGRRRGGVGAAFHAGFERWVAAQDDHQLSLGVVSANSGGLRFWGNQGYAQDRTVEAQSFGRLTHDVQVLTKSVR